jgi:hypothetical protein
MTSGLLLLLLLLLLLAEPLVPLLPGMLAHFLC